MITGALCAAAKKDCLNFVLPYGIGDTLMVCLRKEELEVKYRAKLHFIIKPNHKDVLELLGIDDYTVVQFSPYNASDKKELMQIGNANRQPCIGKLFVAHPVFVDSTYETCMKKWDGFREWFSDFLRLERTITPPNINPPTPSANLLDKVAAITPGPLNQVAIFLPDATSVRRLPNKYWDTLAQQLAADGITAITNTSPGRTIPGISNIECSIKELYYLCSNSASTFSLRSGICDLLVGLGSKLHIAYPNDEWILSFYSVNAIFQRTDIDEYIA